MSKCQVCKRQAAIWAMQYIASDEPSFYTLGSHIRGFKVTKVCDACKFDTQIAAWRSAYSAAEEARQMPK